MTTKPEITIRTNIITGEHFDKDGNAFSRNLPTASVKSQFRLHWHLYQETTNAGNAAVNINEWIKADYTDCGALVTCDNDYRHREKGKLTEVVYDTANQTVINYVRITTENKTASYPQSGFLFLLHKDPFFQEFVKVPYSSFAENSSTGELTFYVNFDISDDARNFPINQECFIASEPFFQSVFVPEMSDPGNGVFVFDVSVYSSKLESAAETASGRNIACNGIELLPYTVDENNVYRELPSFLCDTFSLTVNMGTAGDTPEVTTEVENQIAAIVAAKTASLLEMIKAKQIYQYSETGASWHDAFQTGDKLMRERKNVDGAEWSDAYPISPPAVFTNAIVYDFETTAGQDAALSLFCDELGIAEDAQPQVSLWHYEDDDGLKRVADTTYQAIWYSGGLVIEYYQPWIAGKWQLKLS